MDIRGKTFTVIDFETTGINFGIDRILEVGACRIQDGEITEHYSEYVYSEVSSNPFAAKVHKIPLRVTNAAGRIEPALDRLISFIGDSTLVAHNAYFDVNMLRRALERRGGTKMDEFPYEVICTMESFKRLRSLNGIQTANNKLSTLCEYFKINQKNYHSAGEDAVVTAMVFLKIHEMDEDAIRVDMINVAKDVPRRAKKTSKKKTKSEKRPGEIGEKKKKLIVPKLSEEEDAALEIYECRWKDLPDYLKTKTVLGKLGATALSKPVAKIRRKHGLFYLYDERNAVMPTLSVDDVLDDVRKIAEEYFLIACHHKRQGGDVDAEEKGWKWLTETFKIEDKKRSFADLDKDTCVAITSRLEKSVKKIQAAG